MEDVDADYGIALGDPQDDPSVIFNIEEPNEDESEKIKQRLSTLEVENTALKAAKAIQREPSFEHNYQPPSPVLRPIPVTQENPEADAQLEAELWKPGNAAKVLKNITTTAANLGRQHAQNDLVPYKAALIKQQIEVFKMTNKMDPEVEKHFNKTVKQFDDNALANVDPSGLSQQLDQVRKLSTMAAIEEDGYTPQNLRRAQAPNYGGGGGSSAPRKGQQVVSNLTPKQREFVRVAREEYKWPDKDIYEMIKKGEV